MMKSEGLKVLHSVLFFLKHRAQPVGKCTEQQPESLEMCAVYRKVRCSCPYRDGNFRISDLCALEQFLKLQFLIYRSRGRTHQRI